MSHCVRLLDVILKESILTAVHASLVKNKDSDDLAKSAIAGALHLSSTLRLRVFIIRYFLKAVLAT